MLIALFFVYQPQQTIGQASTWTNTLSLAFLSGANQGSLDDPQQAKHQVADHLFDTLIYRPWVVLEFGGLSHCVDTDRTDDDGFPRPVSPHDPARDVCRDHLKAGRDGHGGYATRYLNQPPGSDKRKAEYDALREGSTLPTTRQFAGYQVDKADAPAVDIQQARRRVSAPDLFRGRVPWRARRGRAAGHAVAGGHPGPGRRARAARLRAGGAGDRNLSRGRA